MRIVVVSDTHGAHAALGRLAGDVLIHCGDFCREDEDGASTIRDVDRWFGEQDFRLIVCVGGNHDFALEEVSRRGESPFRNAHYLVDAGVEFDGLTFYGAPWVPELRDWAYFEEAPEIDRRWAMIPTDTDVLITHVPPYDTLDRNSRARHCGCRALAPRVERIAPRLHCFGHIHASSGVLVEPKTTFLNASMVDRTGRVVRAPYVVEL